MGKLAAIAKLTRIEHSVMLVIAVIAAEIISGILSFGQVHIWYLIGISMITPVFVSMGSFAVNDYYDVEADMINKRKERPLIAGHLSKRQAAAIAAASFIIGVAAATLINAYAFIIALVFAVLAFVYSYRAKELPLIGNVIIALSMAIPFIFGNVVVTTSVLPSMVAVSAMIFLAGLAREIHGMIRDYRGDIKARNSDNIVRHIGIEGSAHMALVLYTEAVAISIFMFFYTKPFAGNLVYLLPVLLADGLLLYVSIAFLTRRSRAFFDIARNISLAAMTIALAAFVGSALFYAAL